MQHQNAGFKGAQSSQNAEKPTKSEVSRDDGLSCCRSGPIYGSSSSTMSSYRRSAIKSTLVFGCLLLASGFTLKPAFPSYRSTHHVSPSTRLSALTERQMQFWEDVEDGLDDVQNVYASKGQDIDRIRTFGKRRVLL